jgi:hypothetical protein
MVLFNVLVDFCKTPLTEENNGLASFADYFVLVIGRFKIIPNLMEVISIVLLIHQIFFVAVLLPISAKHFVAIVTVLMLGAKVVGQVGGSACLGVQDFKTIVALSQFSIRNSEKLPNRIGWIKCFWQVWIFQLNLDVGEGSGVIGAEVMNEQVSRAFGPDEDFFAQCTLHLQTLTFLSLLEDRPNRTAFHCLLTHLLDSFGAAIVRKDA